VIWSFRPGLAAAAVVDPGEILVVETRDALDGTVRPGMQEVPQAERANPATGPIAVRGVEPGNVLAVDILAVDPAPEGYLTFHRRPRFFSQTGGLIPFGPSTILAAAPMIGTIGVAPAQGEINNKLPGDHGGNMDTRDVAAGATLYLTAQVAGGMLALGDVHSLQGDGETSGQGIETAAEVTLRVRVLARGLSTRPYLVRGGELMVVVSAETLDAAAREAVEETARILEAHGSLPYDEARMLLSLVGDLRVGQIVNPLKTVRMAVPLDAVPWKAAEARPGRAAPAIAGLF
jgi:amidase